MDGWNGWDGGGMMGGGFGAIWVLMVVFWILLLGLIAFLVVRLLPGGGTGHAPQVDSSTGRTAPLAETPEQILDRLFAVGEIDEQTYRSRRTALAEMRREP